jgi:hypothetical protein
LAGAPLQSVVAYSVCVRVTLPAATVGGGGGGGDVRLVVVAMQWNVEEVPVWGITVHVVPSATLLYAMPVPVHVGSDEE